jgi:U3 small nucleolar RNA-associated protein 21
MLAAASEMGHITLWDLGSGGRLLHTVRGAHDGSISALEWIPGQPLLISSGHDNSVKVCAQDGDIAYLADNYKAMAL